MKAEAPKTVSLGELILATFDEAAQCCADPREAARMAVQAVIDMLAHAAGLPNNRLSDRSN
jgi:hypothetical protein